VSLRSLLRHLERTIGTAEAPERAVSWHLGLIGSDVMNTPKLIACGILAGGILAGLVTKPDAQSVATAFVGVSALPMDKEAVLADQTVIVRDGKIVSIAPAAKAQIPAGAIRIDGTGKYLMPALAEMHAHIPGGQAPDAAVERTLFLYAANGVTTIRGMLGDPRHLIYRERAARGEIVSPLIYTSGPSFNAKTASTKEMAVEAVIAQKKAGYDLLKIHPGVPRDVFDALAAKADELKIPFAGHVPAAVGLMRALEARYASIDHLDGFVEALTKDPSATSTNRRFPRWYRRRKPRGCGRCRLRSCSTTC